MTEQLKLMAVLAHPDDETLGMGGTLARYAAEGVKTYLVTATGGERGWFGEGEYPGAEALAQIRRAELQAAAEVLGLQEVNLLNYQDGELDQADPGQVIAKIVAHLRRVRPQVVVTFDPYGAYGHPDHIAICQFATAAVVAAADPGYTGDGDMATAHRVSKLYYFVETGEILDIYQAAFGELVMSVDGDERRAHSWEPWAITTMVDSAAYRQQVWDAIACHQSQVPGYQALQDLPETSLSRLWQRQTYYRVFSLVNGGRERESDLFEGLR